MNPTMKGFGYPETVVRNYDHWVVLVRPKQVTLGSLVLACSEPVQRFSEVSPSAFSELKTVITHLESTLLQAFQYERINYLMLMMVDPDVHWHVIPRYSAPREFGPHQIIDAGWPGPPDLKTATPFQAAELAALRDRLCAAWPQQ